MRVDVQLNSLWVDPEAPPAETLPSRSSADVCVIGAGIAGLSAAYHLSRAGRKVVVLDDGPIAGGNTGRTTAHLASAIDDRFVEIERIHGEAISRLAAQSHATAIDAIEEVVKREGIECAFERLDGYLFMPPDQSTDLLEREEAAARRAGLEVERVARAPLDGFETGPCLRFHRQGQFDPTRYLTGLSRAIQRAGGRILTGVRASHIEGTTAGAFVHTRDEKLVEASAVVVATNTPVNDRFVLHTKQAPYLTYAVALEVPAGTVRRALYWDTLDPYHYVRLAAGSGGHEHLIVGGEDHKTGQASDHAERFDRLVTWARERFPISGRVCHQWTGQVMETLDGLAFIGRNPADESNIFVATGDSGMGMTHGTIAGLLLTDLIVGRPNAWTEVYDPRRRPVHTLKDFLSENLNAAAQYGAWVTPGEVSSEADVPAGGGAVVRHGLKKLAVSRDDAGTVCVRSAVCPHLGGIVSWNSAEKTWDCPLHGSRFDRCGKMINGPSNGDLATPEEKAE